MQIAFVQSVCNFFFDSFRTWNYKKQNRNVFNIKAKHCSKRSAQITRRPARGLRVLKNERSKNSGRIVIVRSDFFGRRGKNINSRTYTRT